MGRHTIFVMLALTGVWIILMEYLSWQNIAVGMFVSMLCMHFIGKFLRFNEIENVNFYRLATYPLWLVMRIYMDAFFMVRMIFSNPKCGVATEKVNIDNESLRIILADSITLTPGSVYIGMEDDQITLLCIGNREYEGFPVTMHSLRTVENVLLKTQGAKPKDEEKS